MAKYSFGRLAVLLVAAQALNSCSLPPREAWQRIKDEGVLHALFAPRRMVPGNADRLAGGPTGAGAAGVGASGVAAVSGEAMGPRIPTAEVFPGHRGFVYSPFTRPKKLVNTAGFAAGEHALCPYTLELFVVPDYGQGEAVAARPERSRMGPEKEASPGRGPGPVNPAVVEVVSRDLTSPLPPSLPAAPPYGEWVAGRPGYVYSPFAAKHQLVDVTGIASGVEVKCPYTGRLFRVPEPAGVADPARVSPLADPAGGVIEVPMTPVDPAAAPTAPPTPPVPPAAPSSPGTDSKAPPTPPAPVEEPLPTAVWADGKSGLVQSPFGEPGQLVDVSGKEAGAKVICPFSNKAFLVPAK